MPKAVSKSGKQKAPTFAGDFTWYAYGDDFGNSEMCGVLIKNGKSLTMSVATAFAQVDGGTLRNMGVDMSKSIVIQFEGDGSEWALGESAMLQAAHAIWNGRGDVMRYASKHNARNICAISSLLTNDPEYGLLVTCGLPAETYQSNPDLRKDIRNAIECTYTFI